MLYWQFQLFLWGALYDEFLYNFILVWRYLLSWDLIRSSLYLLFRYLALQYGFLTDLMLLLLCLLVYYWIRLYDLLRLALWYTLLYDLMMLLGYWLIRYNLYLNSLAMLCNFLDNLMLFLLYMLSLRLVRASLYLFLNILLTFSLSL